MKKIYKVLILSAILAGVFGVSLQKNKDVLKTEAAPITQGTKLYLKPNANWLIDSPRFAVYLFGGSPEAWQDMTQVTGNPSFYEVTVSEDASFNNVIFARMKPSESENNWDNRWNQTDNLVFDGTKNLFTVAEGTWDKGGGVWSVYVHEELPPAPELTPTVEGINNGKVRIWLDRSPSYDTGYEIAMKINEVHYKPSGYAAALHAGRWFAYYDMPISVLENEPSIDLVVILNGAVIIKVIPTGVYSAGDNNKVWIITKTDDVVSFAKGSITERIVASFMAKVLEGYLTCSDSAENGYNAFPAIDANFLPRADGVWNMEGDLGGELGVKITDYAGEGISAYGSDRGTGVQVDAYIKYTALQNMYLSAQMDGARFGTNVGEGRNNTGVALLVLTLGIAVFAGFYFIYKKKFVVM